MPFATLARNVRGDPRRNSTPEVVLALFSSIFRFESFDERSFLVRTTLKFYLRFTTTGGPHFGVSVRSDSSIPPSTGPSIYRHRRFLVRFISFKPNWQWSLFMCFKTDLAMIVNLAFYSRVEWVSNFCCAIIFGYLIRGMLQKFANWRCTQRLVILFH